MIKATHVAAYKQVNEISKDGAGDVNLMSIDTGMNGNLFGGNYFSMNRDHIRGDLKTVSTNFTELKENEGNYKLSIRPLGSKP